MLYKCFRILITAVLAMFMMPSVLGRIINIPADYPTITEGIDASVDGDTVLVAPGQYQEFINPQGKNILITSSNGPDTTIIHGYITFNSNEDTTCIFRGFTVIGWGNDPYTVPPAILCEGMGKPKIIGNIVRNNICLGSKGGGIGVYLGKAIIRHNIIESNYAMGQGGGVYCYGRDIEISSNIIRNNSCGMGQPWIGWGGGMYCIGGRVFRNLIYNNEVGGYPPDQCGVGGGIHVAPTSQSSFTHIYNNTIVGNISQRNDSTGNGGGMSIWGFYYYDTVVVENNIIAFNHNGGMASASSNETREVIVEYNLFYGNSKYDLWKTDTSETLIFDEDPMFVDTSDNNFGLLPNSPCIDAGNADYPLDPDSTRVDIGALFYDQSTAIDDSALDDEYLFELRQNYPNPFNSETTIEYSLPFDALVNLVIFDITGRIVKNIINDEVQIAGNYSYLWDGTNNNNKEVSTAIYFYQLKINDKRRVKSMILIK